MPKTISGDVREIILRVRDYFEQEKNNLGPVISVKKVQERVAAATGVSRRLVSIVVKEGRIAAATGTKILTPGFGKIRKTRKDKMEMDDFTRDVIRKTIREHIAIYNEPPSVSKLLKAVKEETSFAGSQEILRRFVKRMAGDASQPKPNTASPKLLRTQKNCFNTQNVPNKKSKKDALVGWLRNSGVSFSTESSKQQLLELVRTHRPKKVYAVNGILDKLGTDEDKQLDPLPVDIKCEPVTTNPNETTSSSEEKYCYERESPVIESTESDEEGAQECAWFIKEECNDLSYEAIDVEYHEIGANVVNDREKIANASIKTT